jgi:heat-inducible transcriptional repressor
MNITLSDRQQQVLGATVRQYIVTAKPVGSEALVEEFKPKVSSATIRNTMGFLEKAGFLYQPHTSAGRVPSDSGYRVYVDQMIVPSDVAARQVDRLLTDRLNPEQWSLEALLRGAAHLLASVSGYITLITLPQSKTARLRHVQLVQIDPGRVMLIVVLDSYETESIIMNLADAQNDPPADSDLIERELQIISNFLNTHLRGCSLSDIANLKWSQLGRDFEQYAQLLKDALVELNDRCRVPVSPQLLISGVSEVLRRQPEFSEIQQVQTIIHLLESEQDQLWSLIFETTEASQPQRVTVRIGSENPLELIHSCALVSATYHRGDVAVGTVSMLGPTRMVYEDAIALVETTADYLSDTLSQSS